LSGLWTRRRLHRTQPLLTLPPIGPLCKVGRVQEAMEMFDAMLQRGMSPLMSTFHALLNVAMNPTEVFHLLDKMKELQSEP